VLCRSASCRHSCWISRVLYSLAFLSYPGSVCYSPLAPLPRCSAYACFRGCDMLVTGASSRGRSFQRLTLTEHCTASIGPRPTRRALVLQVFEKVSPYIQLESLVCGLCQRITHQGINTLESTRLGVSLASLVFAQIIRECCADVWRSLNPRYMSSKYKCTGCSYFSE
jgi:hypothetical protein